MGRVMELQPWLTVAAETASISKTQDKDDWIDTSNHEACTLCIEALQVVGGSLFLEGCDSQGGLFEVLSTIAAPARTTYVVLRRSDDTTSATRLPKYIRWTTTDGGGGTLEVCFRITCSFK